MSDTVHIVDDDPSFRTATSRLLQACGYAVALYELGEALLAQLPTDAGSCCILLDVRIPGLSGPELQARLTEMGSHLPIVFLTGHGDISTAVQVRPFDQANGKGRVAGRYRASHRAGRVRQQEDDRLEGLGRRVSSLTPRERQVFERVARGGLNKQIAYELGTTERTERARFLATSAIRAISLTRWSVWRHPRTAQSRRIR